MTARHSAACSGAVHGSRTGLACPGPRLLNSLCCLQGLVKALDAEMARELTVAAAKHETQGGVVKVLKEGWFSGRSLYFE